MVKCPICRDANMKGHDGKTIFKVTICSACGKPVATPVRKPVATGGKK